jgi:hypothetical protein
MNKCAMYTVTFLASALRITDPAYSYHRRNGNGVRVRHQSKKEQNDARGGATFRFDGPKMWRRDNSAIHSSTSFSSGKADHILRAAGAVQGLKPKTGAARKPTTGLCVAPVSQLGEARKQNDPEVLLFLHQSGDVGKAEISLWCALLLPVSNASE